MVQDRIAEFAFDEQVEVNGQKCRIERLGNPFMGHFQDTVRRMIGPEGQSNPFFRSFLQSAVARQATSCGMPSDQQSSNHQSWQEARWVDRFQTRQQQLDLEGIPPFLTGGLPLQRQDSGYQ